MVIISRYQDCFGDSERKRDGKYIGYTHNGLPERKGIYYFYNGDRRMGDYYDDKKIGKHVTLTSNGNVETEIY